MLTFIKKMFRTNDSKAKDNYSIESRTEISPKANLTGDELKNLAYARMREGQIAEAKELYKKALVINPNLENVHSMLGYICREQGKLLEAEAYLGQALQINPLNGDAHFMLAGIAMSKGDTKTAIDGYLQAVKIDPQLCFAHKELCVAYLQTGNLLKAEEAATRGLEFFPDFDELHFFMGILHYSQNRYKKAHESFERALALECNTSDLHYNYGLTLQALNRLDEALYHFEKAVNLSQGNVTEIRFNESICHLLMGDFDRGLKKYELRWQTKAMHEKEALFTQPKWLGEQSLDGKTLLIVAEQGYGDVIQFIRYTNLAIAQGAKILLMLFDPLAPLMQQLAGGSKILSINDPLPHFDYYCPVMSLPLAFKTTLDTIPAFSSYLHADPKLTSEWQETLGESRKLKIGIAWSGNPMHVNDKNRSMELQKILPLFDNEELFVCVQKEILPSEQTVLSNLKNARHYGEKMPDFASTAALINALDLIICVDTSSAHLAAAMGKTVWLMLPFHPDWRWLLERDTSPWYPSMRLFRQQSIGDWESVIYQVNKELENFLHVMKH
ncbi:tetratricopeptide repeat protein [Undibacterium sp. TJN19]|uniref:tetratricopeptide repeat protein n=1 Tax=Undibacterium sp. TJN19 TaxID=3413055 RepID=UPI003BF225BA